MTTLNDTKSQYLTFQIGEDVFALEIAKVHEILSYTRITRVPRMPKFLNGVINLRGHIVPVVDLRHKLGMAPSEMTSDTCIVITETTIQGEAVIVGILTDSVREVINLEPEQIFLPPKVGIRINPEFVKHIGKHENLMMILDIDRVLAFEEI
jgi:purine-binding chemotaxis protein CheW